MRHWSIVLFAALPATVLAHEGHGAFDHPWLHQMTDPIHVLPILIALITLIAAVVMYRFRRARK